MITPFELDSAWRDYWNLWGPMAIAQISPLQDSLRYTPRVRIVPSSNDQIMPQAGKIESNFDLTPGSIVWGLWAGPSAQLPFVFQVTQADTGHSLFQEPTSTNALPNATNAVAPTSPWNYALLPCPWPVVGDGLFLGEIWGTVGSRYYLIIGIAEVEECPH